MDSQASSRNASVNVRLNYDDFLIATAGKQRTDGPNNRFDSLSSAPRVLPLEIATLNAPERTNLMEQFGRQYELPHDLIAAVTHEPRLSADFASVLAAASVKFNPPPISLEDLQFSINVNAQAGGGTAVGAVQDQQQDCCNCCNLQ